MIDQILVFEVSVLIREIDRSYWQRRSKYIDDIWAIANTLIT